LILCRLPTGKNPSRDFPLFLATSFFSFLIEMPLRSHWGGRLRSSLFEYNVLCPPPGWVYFSITRPGLKISHLPPRFPCISPVWSEKPRGLFCLTFAPLFAHSVLWCPFFEALSPHRSLEIFLLLCLMKIPVLGLTGRKILFLKRESPPPYYEPSSRFSLFEFDVGFS